MESSATNPLIAESYDFKRSKYNPRYAYNANGAMTGDLNRGITNVKYNILNLPENITVSTETTKGSVLNVYDANGTKLRETVASSPLVYYSPIVGIAIFSSEVETNITNYLENKVYKNGVLSRILFDGGYIENDTYHYYERDHLGNNIAVISGSNGSLKQSNLYYPFGLPMAEGTITEHNVQPYKYNGKEFQTALGLNQYDYGARFYDPAIGRFMTVDPLAEKYYWISPYAYCLNNPIKYIDPDGRDVWELDESGNIINRIEDKTQDAFFMVAKDADGNYQRTYTTDADGNKNYNSISFDYGTVKSVKEETVIRDGKEIKMTAFNIKGDDSATQLFEFMAKPNETTNVEWAQLKTGKIAGDNGMNIVGTSHEKKTFKVNNQGCFVREMVHNHPSGSDRPSPKDLSQRISLLSSSPNMKFFIYTTNYGYRPYTTNMDILLYRVRDYAK